jgi:hypothetical protein
MGQETLKRLQGFPSKKAEVGPAPDLQMTVGRGQVQGLPYGKAPPPPRGGALVVVVVVVAERDISGENIVIRYHRVIEGLPLRSL